MASLEHRIVDLEAALPRQRTRIAIFIEGVPGRDAPPRGEIIGIKDVAKRQRGESEKDFLERAVALERAKAAPGQMAVLLLVERSIRQGHSDDA